MKVLGIYGSPRKDGNSDLLLDKVLEGAKSAGVGEQRIKSAHPETCGRKDPISSERRLLKKTG